MKELFVKGRTLPEAYHAALRALQSEGEILSCADYDQKQKEASMTMCVLEPLREPMISKLYIGGHRELQQYVMEMLDGLLDFEIGRGFDYTYHDRIGDQTAFVAEELRRTPDSRRAVIDIRDKDFDRRTRHPACLQHMQFFIRNNALECKVLMRSNDAAEATFMNAFAFIMLQKRIAEELGVSVGGYTHRANSFHAYEKDFALLDNYVRRLDSGEDVCYEYEGFYEELMAEAVPEILRAVEELKRGKNAQ